MCYWFGGGSGIWMAAGGLMVLVFWVAIVSLGVWAVLRLTRRHGTADSRALETIRERYARGEIGREEFERIKKDLS